MRTILVTGGAGYVGSILVKTLLESGYRIICVDNLLQGGNSLLGTWDHPDFHFYKCDITDFDSFDKVLRKGDYFAIVHLAAIVGDPACKRNPELATNTNYDASRYVLEKSIELKIPRFIFASTCSNYGKMPDSDDYVTEVSPLAPVSLYAELKVKVENMLLNDLPRKKEFVPTALRFSTVYGLSPRMRFDLTVNEFTKELALKKELIVFGEQFWRPYCHVADFSKAILSVLNAPSSKVAYNVFNVGDTSENYTKAMIITELVKQFPKANVRYVKKDEDPRDYRVSFEKIKKDLGFTISKRVPEGIKEIKKVIKLGIIKDPEDQSYYNIPHLRTQ